MPSVFPLSDRTALWLLVFGALVGAGAAVVEIIAVPERSALGDDVVAVVNGDPIYRADYDRALTAVAMDRREGTLSPTDRERVLDRLIDHQLLVQGGVELALHLRDSRVRNDIATAMIEFVSSRSEDGDIGDDELEAFWRREQMLFQAPARYRVQHAFFSGPVEQARLRANAARARPELVGDSFGLELPDGLLPLSTIRQRLGVSAARAVAELGPGETSAPVEVTGGVHLVRVVERHGGEVRPFAEVKDQVRAAYEREVSERALREFLKDARQRAHIEIGSLR